MSLAWFQEHFAADTTAQFETWWLAENGPPENYGRPGPGETPDDPHLVWERDEYWMRKGFAWQGWNALENILRAETPEAGGDGRTIERTNEMNVKLRAEAENPEELNILADVIDEKGRTVASAKLATVPTSELEQNAKPEPEPEDGPHNPAHTGADPNAGETTDPEA